MTAPVPQRALPPAARFLPRRWFYGWYVAIACSLLMFVGVGVGYYGLPVFLSPLREAHGWSTAQVSWAPAIYFCVSGLAAAIVGPHVDRHGPLRLMLVGSLANGVSAAAIGIVNELWQLYLVYFVFAVAFGISSAVAVNAIMARWFVRKRALAMSVAMTGVSLGGVILAPVASTLIDIGGLGLATPVLGALIIIVSLPVVLGVIVFDPRQVGLLPDGDPPDATPPPSREAALSAQLRAWTRSEAIRTVGFWGILIAFLIVLVAQTGYVIHQVAFLEERLGSRSAAAFTLSVTAFGSIVARLAVGLFADNVDRRLLTVILFVVQATAVLLIVHIENVATTWALTLVFGFTFGNIYLMQSLLVGELFGMVSFGAIFGLISLAGQVGSGLGPIGVGLLHDATGGYTVPFTITAILTYVAAFAVLFVRPAKDRAAEAPAAAAPHPLPLGR
jgi:MFS family permease